MVRVKKLFFIDFDDTLFNTKKFKKELIGIFRKNGVSEKQFKEFYYIKKDNKAVFSPEKQIENLKMKYNINDRRLLFDFNIFMGDISEFLFKDTKKFLRKVKNKNNYLVLLSYGEPDFQKKKILSSGIAYFFDEIIITGGLKLNIMEKHKMTNQSERIIFIEDHPKQLDVIMEKILDKNKRRLFKKMDVIKITRKNGRYSKIKTKFFFNKFSDLDEVIKKVC